jgi:hypothetical protein
MVSIFRVESKASNIPARHRLRRNHAWYRSVSTYGKATGNVLIVRKESVRALYAAYQSTWRHIPADS